MMCDVWMIMCVQSTKMILKFRETHISNLEKASQSNENVTESTAIVSSTFPL